MFYINQKILVDFYVGFIYEDFIGGNYLRFLDGLGTNY